MKEKDTVPIFKSKEKTTIETTKTIEIPKWLANLIKLGVSISKSVTK